MTKRTARLLKRGDTVFTLNGPYKQVGTVTEVELDGRGFYFISYTWWNPSGKLCKGRKRHTSVYVEQEAA